MSISTRVIEEGNDNDYDWKLIEFSGFENEEDAGIYAQGIIEGTQLNDEVPEDAEKSMPIILYYPLLVWLIVMKIWKLIH